MEDCYTCTTYLTTHHSLTRKICTSGISATKLWESHVQKLESMNRKCNGGELDAERLEEIKRHPHSIPESFLYSLTTKPKSFLWLYKIDVGKSNMRGLYSYAFSVPDATPGDKYKIHTIDIDKDKGPWIVTITDPDKFYYLSPYAIPASNEFMLGFIEKVGGENTEEIIVLSTSQSLDFYSCPFEINVEDDGVSFVYEDYDIPRKAKRRALRGCILQEREECAIKIQRWYRSYTCRDM